MSNLHHAHGDRLSADGAMNFAPRNDAALSDTINRLIDEALETENRKQAPRTYLGGSRLGVECLRALAFEWHEQKRWRADYEEHTVDVAAGRWLGADTFPGKAIRRFQMGHLHEDETARWLKLAGFDLRTEKADGGQFGFGIKADRGTGRKLIAGHFDGAILRAPVSMRLPALWEHKIMNSKNWQGCLKEGVEKSKPVYWAQCQTYMAYSPLALGADMQLESCLFTALNTDTSELLFEVIPFKPEDAQWASDRGVQVVESRAPEELPRITSDPNDFRCRWCDHKKRCWSIPVVEPAAERPGWL